MFVSEKFSYNGIDSDDMLDTGLMIVRTDENNLTQVSASPKTFIRQHVQYRNTNYYMGADKNIYSFTIKITKKDGTAFTYDDRKDLMRIFLPDDNFHPFISEDFPQIEFWVQFNKSSFVNYFSNQGYFLLEAESNSAYPFSPILYSEWDLSTNSTSTIIEVFNSSNIMNYCPINILEFTLVDNATSFKIINHTNAGKIYEFTGLSLLETVSTNSAQEIISSTGISKIDNFNFGFEALNLPYGKNRLEVFSKCRLKILQQFPMQI